MSPCRMATGDNPDKWPIDFEALRRGSSIDVKVLESIFGFGRLTDEFRFKALKLKEQIEKHFEDHGDPVCVRMRDRGLQVLTHPEQAEYVRLRDRLSRRVQMRSYYKATGVDREMLSDEQKVAHDRFLHVAAFRRLMMQKRPPPMLGE